MRGSYKSSPSLSHYRIVIRLFIAADLHYPPATTPTSRSQLF